MKIKGVLAIGAVCCAAGLGIGFTAFADPMGDKNAAGNPIANMDPQAMMEMCAKLAQPGAEHKIIQDFAGTWDVEVRFWMDPTSPDPSVSHGVMTVQMMHGDKFALGDYEGSMDMPGKDGKPEPHKFTGTMMWGYNNVDKRYESMWCDSMGTMMLLTQGMPSDDGKTVKSKGQFSMPLPDGGKMQITQRDEFTMHNKDKYTMTAWHSMGGQENKAMELTYARKTGKPADAKPRK